MFILGSCTKYFVCVSETFHSLPSYDLCTPVYLSVPSLKVNRKRRTYSLDKDFVHYGLYSYS